uniref:GST C-terminal domain-containing protein n=1 Tax=Heterosigma akashiwo TaxID=2829 RepID=A0A7S4DCY0_HETAK
MKEVDEALGSTEGPWFLGGDSPSLVDLAYVTHIERMVASLLYWKGFQIRNAGYSNVDRWLEAFEQRPAYMATKSDYYTHVMDIPPQYGPGFFAAGAEDAQRRTVEGLDGSWALPLAPLGPGSFEPTTNPAELEMGDEAARHHAAFQLASNAEAVVRFACRGAGGLPLGAKGFQAPLADPYCEPNLGYQPDVDALLRHVAYALLEGTSATENAAAADIASSCADDDAKAVAACAAYLRDRVGVPRDLPLPAARQLRAHLHWAAGLLLREEAGK